jgi:hypothetical protein
MQSGMLILTCPARTSELHVTKNTCGPGQVQRFVRLNAC